MNNINLFVYSDAKDLVLLVLKVHADIMKKKKILTV